MNLRFTFRKYERINRKKDIQEIFNKGKKIFVNGLIVYILKRSPEFKYSRLAVLVSNKVEKLAVVRNKFKRRIREIFRLNKYKIKYPVDIIVIATKISIRKKYSFLEENFIKVLSHEGLV